MRPGTRYQTTFEIRRVLLTVFVETWKLFFSRSASVHSAIGDARLCAIQIYYWLQSCRAHVQGLKRPHAAVPDVGFYPCCRHAVSTSTSLGVHRPAAGAVLPTVHDRTEGVPDRWRSCLERSSIWRYVCSVAGRLRAAVEDRTLSPLLQCCLTLAWPSFLL